jgi:hypothetical protein
MNHEVFPQCSIPGCLPLLPVCSGADGSPTCQYMDYPGSVHQYRIPNTIPRDAFARDVLRICSVIGARLK